MTVLLLGLGIQALVAPKIPTAVPVGLASPVEYAIREVPAPKGNVTRHEDGSLTLRIGSRAVRLRGNAEYPQVSGAVVGRDGSILIHRYAPGESWAAADAILKGGRETAPVVGVAFYWDAANYVGSYVPDVGPLGMSYSASRTIAAVAGRRVDLGWGSPVKAWSPTEVLASVTVDVKDQPSGYDQTDASFLRLFRGGRTYEIGRFEFVGALPDRTLVLRRTGEIATWRDGRFLSVRRLPAQWEAAWVNGRGDVLCRKWPPLPKIDFEQMAKEKRSPDDIVKAMNQVQRVAGDAERVWDMGLLRGATLTPISFERPKGSERLFWRDSQALADDGRFRFSAFFGPEEHFYEIRPKLPVK
jgi:hypothetical protein